MNVRVSGATEIAGQENAGLEIDGQKLQGVENDGHNIKRINDARARTPWSHVRLRVIRQVTDHKMTLYIPYCQAKYLFR